jgi:hypothetical protein
MPADALWRVVFSVKIDLKVPRVGSGVVLFRSEASPFALRVLVLEGLHFTLGGRAGMAAGSVVPE